MGIDDKLPGMLIDPGAQDATRKSAKEGDKARWLAELEDESFKVHDDLIKASSEGQDDEEPVLGEESARAAIDSATQQDPMVSVAEQALMIALQAQSEGALKTPLSAMQVLVAQQGNAYGTGQPMIRGSAVFRGAPTVQSLQAAQSFDALMNKMRFTDLNIRITQQGDELTLWVRDFTQKYSVEVFNWVKDLQSLLRSSGKSLAKIMVNGKQLQHPNQLLGGQSWQ